MMDYKLLNFICCICQIAPYIISRADCNSLMGKSLIFQGQEQLLPYLSDLHALTGD